MSQNYMGAEWSGGPPPNIDICPYVALAAAAPPLPTLAFSIDREKGDMSKKDLIEPFPYILIPWRRISRLRFGNGSQCLRVT